MFKNFKEKTFTEKTARILAIPATIITIFLGIKTLFFSNEKKTIQPVQNSGDNSTIITGNGNTINHNSYNTTEYKGKQINETIKPIENNSITETSYLKDDGKIKIAVLPFEYLSNETKYEWLKKGIPETILHPISSNEKYTVLEGNLRDKVIEEINFQQGKYTDIKSAVKIGKLLGANQIVIGSYQINNDKIKITSRIVNVETGKIIENSTIDYEDLVDEPFKMQKNYASYFKTKIID
jgi:TolB-like protein